MIDPNKPNSFYSETAFAEILGLSKGTVKKLRQSGLYHVRVGRRILFNDGSFRDLVRRYAIKPSDRA